MNWNQQDDALDHFFRKGLSEKNDILLGDEEWDMPSDGVWTAIETNLPVKEEVLIRSLPIRGQWWAIAASVLLLLFAFSAYNSIKEIGTLQEQVALQSGQLKDLQEKNNSTIAVLPIQQTASIEEKVNTFLAKAEQPFKGNKELIAAAKSKTSKKSNTTPVRQVVATTDISQQISTPVSAENVTEFIKPTDYANNRNTIADKRSFAVPAKAVLASLPIDIIEDKIYNNNVTLFHSQPLIDPVEPSKKRAFYAGLFAAPAHWIAKVTAKSNNETITKGTPNQQHGVETGVKFGWQINDNWALETGLSYAKNSQEINHKMTFPYDPGKERPAGTGVLASTYDTQLGTNYGNMSVAVDVSRNIEQTLLPGEIINMESNNSITTALLQLPLAARYGVQKGKLNVSLSAGMLFSFLQSQQIALSKEGVTSHPNLSGEHPRLQGERPALKKMHYAVQTGAQLAYSPNKKLDIYISPTYTQGLTPIAENDEVSTTLAQVALMAGVNVRF